MNCENMTDEEIVGKILSDHNFFQCIVTHYEHKLHSFVFRRSGLSNPEIDEILQESYIRVFVNIRDFDLKLKFQNWIYRIVRNTMIDYLRSNHKRRSDLSLESTKSSEKNLMNLLASDEDIAHNTEINLELQKLEKIVNELPDQYREIAILRFWEEKEYSEISDIIRKPAGTVGSLVNRVRKRILEKYKRGNF